MAGPSTQDLSEIDQGVLKEEFPYPVDVSNEEILNTNRSHNAWIIIGRDRPKGIKSGYGQFAKKQGGGKCTTIDIVVGRSSVDSNTGKVTSADRVGNNIQLDASRIYISQKTDIDKNFLIEEAGTLVPSYGKASIGIKSDNIRIVSRESVKIVANSGDVNSLDKKASNSKPVYGIQLICGAKTDPKDVQSIVKSENLRTCLDKMITMIDECYAALNDFIDKQQIYNMQIANHMHYGYFNPSPIGSVVIDLPMLLNGQNGSMDAAIEKVKQTIDQNRSNRKMGIIKDHLTKAQPEQYIGSRFNYTN